MKYRLAVFDMDGTILDTLEDLTDSMNFTLTHFGYPTRTIDEIRSFVGNGLAKLMERACPPGTDAARLGEVLGVFNGHYARHCADKTGPYPGILSLIRDLRAAGMLTAVVSNKADYGVQELCHRYFEGLFDAAVGERPGVMRKPAPDMVRAVLARLGVDRAEAVYIGDSDVDVMTAKNSGLDLVAVAWGFRTVDFLKSAGALRIAGDAGELKNILLAP